MTQLSKIISQKPIRKNMASFLRNIKKILDFVGDVGLIKKKTTKIETFWQATLKL